MGNRVMVFPDNDAALESMWSAIQAVKLSLNVAFSSHTLAVLQAKHFIVMETYSVEADFVGERTLIALINAMKRGVRVTLIFDDVGSPDLTWNMLMQELLSLGADVISFNPIDFESTRRRFNPFLRNHRKLLVIDDDVGYCGSINLSAEYASIEKGGSGVFRDVHLRIHGSAVVDLLGVMGRAARQNATNRLFGVSSAAILASHEYLAEARLVLARNPRRVRSRGKARLQILEENTLVGKRGIQNAMVSAIRRARE
jgi:phosphatidylserine/phosphatidylglycerophosphate/cardiolipin synthase-like enzyme